MTLSFETLAKQFDSLTQRPSSDYDAFNVDADQLVALCEHLRDKEGFSLLVDVAGIDWNDQSPRFSVAYHLYSVIKQCYVRLVCACVGDESPEVPSIVSVWPAANWHERETYDMFGIHFKGHPDLRRILMWDDYKYHPLRKEFPLAGIEDELPAADIRERVDANIIAAPMMGGPFYAQAADHMSQREPSAADQSWAESNPKRD